MNIDFHDIHADTFATHEKRFVKMKKQMDKILRCYPVEEQEKICDEIIAMKLSRC